MTWIDVNKELPEDFKEYKIKTSNGDEHLAYWEGDMDAWVSEDGIIENVTEWLKP